MKPIDRGDLFIVIRQVLRENEAKSLDNARDRVDVLASLFLAINGLLRESEV